MTKPVILIGAGDHARVLLDTLKILKRKVLGATDRHPDKVNAERLGCALLGTDEAVSSYSPDKIELVNGIGTVRVDVLRANIFKKFKGEGYMFSTVIHPHTYVSSRAILEEGAQVLAGAIVQTGAVISKNAIINTHASVDHDCKIGEHSHIAPGVTLCGEVQIGAGSHVGVGAIVVNGTIIKPGTFIKAGSLVTNKFTSELTLKNRVTQI